jgi:uncharacterized protein with HEPN domain
VTKNGCVISEAIERIERYTKAGRSTFDRDELIQSWVVHHLQIIGEATRRLSQDWKASHPEVPWHAIVGMTAEPNLITDGIAGLAR